MATTVIDKGQVKRRSHIMSIARAMAFAKLLESNPQHSVMDITVIPDGKKGRVEYTPSAAQTVYRLFRELQSARELRAIEQVRRYKWRRIGRRAWSCRGFRGQQYSVFLNKVGNREAHCTCPDWPKISSVGGKCKHFICAEEAEARYQRSLQETAAMNATIIQPDLVDPYKD